MSKRRHISLRIGLDAALLQLGLDPATAECDHHPALGFRERTEDGRYLPDERDPRYLVWRASEAHAEKTFGTKATTANGDLHRIAKSKRLAREEADFRARLLAKSPGEKRRPKGRIPSRPFPKKPARFHARSQVNGER